MAWQRAPSPAICTPPKLQRRRRMIDGRSLLFSPAPLGKRTARNRLIALPHGQNRLTPDQLLAYMPQLARGTAGTVLLGGMMTEPETWRPGLFHGYDPSFTRQLVPVNEAIHAADSLSIAQLLHLGVEALPFTAPLIGARAPSAVPGPGGDVPIAMSEADFAEVRRGYRRTAALLAEAGFDGFDVSSGHNYLLHQFLSPLTNRRRDRYGGSIENRMRFLEEILIDLRDAHPDLVLGVRLPCGDGVPGGLAEEDSLAVGRRLGALGLVDYITVTIASSPSLYVRDGEFPPAGLRASSRRMMAASNCPVVISQRIETPAEAADILAAGDAAFIGLARPLIADPDWGAKAQGGEDEAIRPCIRAVRCRSEHGCDVNPEAFATPPGRPLREPVAAARVVVVGGGPAGCEAALAAAGKGCEVTIFEQQDRLGGRARLAGRAPFRESWTAYSDYLHHAVVNHPAITARLSTPATSRLLDKMAPDLVVQATGASLTLPSPNGLSLTTADAFLLCAQGDGGKLLVIVDEGGSWDAMAALDTAIAAGFTIWYVTPRERVLDKVVAESRAFALDRLRRAEVTISCLTRVRLEPDRLTLAFADGATKRLAPHLVVWCGRLVRNPVPNTGAGVSVLRAGDCLAPRSLRAATADGRALASYLIGPRP
jgi:2,4-dienoyl-CoA reductase (NADPH2)